MKNNPFFRSAWLWGASVFLLALAVVSCRKELDTPAQEPAPQAKDLMHGAFEKTFNLIDATGKNSLTVLASADDKSLLDELSEASFSFEALTSKQPEKPHEPAADGGEVVVNEGRDLHFTVVDSKLEPHAVGFRLAFNPNPDGAVVSRGPVNLWFHNGYVNGSWRWRRNVVFSGSGFYFEGAYKGVWPYWVKLHGDFWTTYTDSGWHYSKNLSSHVTWISGTTYCTFYW